MYYKTNKILKQTIWNIKYNETKSALLLDSIAPLLA